MNKNKIRNIKGLFDFGRDIMLFTTISPLVIYFKDG